MLKGHMDGLVGQARQMAAQQAGDSLESLVVEGKIYKGRGEEVPAEVQARIDAGIQTDLQTMANVGVDMNQYIADWEKRKEHLGIQRLEQVPQSILSSELHRRHSKVV